MGIFKGKGKTKESREVGICKNCAYFQEGNCYEKISLEDVQEREESWENLEKYFSRRKDDYCSSFKEKEY